MMTGTVRRAGPGSALPVRGWLLLLAMAAVPLAGCGGGGSPLGTPPLVGNSVAGGGQKLSFAYFQRCVNPVFLASLPIAPSGSATCSSSGCHNNATGTGGAFRIIPTAQVVDVSNLANTPDVIRASDIYKNFYSTQGEVVIGTPTQSLLIRKPLLLNVNHAGGLIFASDQDLNVRRLETWITNPMPVGQDEFSTAGDALFDSGNPITGNCLPLN